MDDLHHVIFVRDKGRDLTTRTGRCINMSMHLNGGCSTGYWQNLRRKYLVVRYIKTAFRSCEGCCCLFLDRFRHLDCYDEGLEVNLQNDIVCEGEVERIAALWLDVDQVGCAEILDA